MLSASGVIDILLKKLNSKPVGTKENPAMSCRDVFSCQGTSFVAGACAVLCVMKHHMFLLLLVGEYWIDPTEGSPNDAVRVLCSGAETCIKPVVHDNQVSLLPSLRSYIVSSTSPYSSNIPRRQPPCVFYV